MKNGNLFAALRAAFPADLDSTAIQTCDGPGAPLHYRWRDLDRGTAMLANLLSSLELPAGARVAVQTEKSVEALMLYLAVLRAGYVYLPLNTAYQASEIEYFIGNAEPAVVVCSTRNFGWVSKLAFKAGTKNVFTLDDDRTGSLLDRAALHSDRHEVAIKRDDDLAVIVYTSGTTGRSKGAMLYAWQRAEQCARAQGLLGLARRRRVDPRAADLPCARPVRGRARRTAGRRKDAVVRQVRRARGGRAAAAGDGVHGRAHAVRAHARRARPQPPGLRAHAAVHRRIGAAADRDLQRVARAHRPHHPRALRHERDGDAQLQPLRPEARRAARRHRRLPAARRAACVCAASKASRCRPARSARSR